MPVSSCEVQPTITYGVASNAPPLAYMPMGLLSVTYQALPTATSIVSGVVAALLRDLLSHHINHRL